MRAQVKEASRDEILALIRSLSDTRLQGQEQFFFKCVQTASHLWLGYIDGKLVCFWGVNPPSFVSEYAYLWLYMADSIKGQEFLFVRNSQIAVKELLKQYPVIVGHSLVNNSRGIRWLKWLGATFLEPQGKMLPFVIRR